MPVKLLEELACDICESFKPLQKVIFTDKTGFVKTSHQLRLCGECERQLLVYDLAYHSEGSDSFGVKFSKIRDNTHLHYKVIRKIGEKSEWAKVEERSNNSRILITQQWEALKKALENTS